MSGGDDSKPSVPHRGNYGLLNRVIDDYKEGVPRLNHELYEGLVAPIVGMAQGAWKGLNEATVNHSETAHEGKAKQERKSREPSGPSQ